MKYFLFIAIFISIIYSEPPKRVSEITTPENCTRIVFPNGSYAHWLQELPLKSNKKINSWDNSIVWAKFIYRIFYVVDKPLYFKEDLEQCADFSMRFWADYHKDSQNLDSLYLFTYNGEKKYFNPNKKSFKKFLRFHMAYSNSYSVKKGAKKISSDNLIPGDMFVQNLDGGIGHVSVILDVAKSEENERVYLVGYSYMPAQEFHIEKAKSKYGKSGWFTKQGYLEYLGNSRLSKYGSAVIRRY